MKNTKKNISGFTLVELLVVLAISTLVLSGVLSLITPVKSMFYDTSRIQEQRSICRNLTKYVEENIRYSNDVIIIKNT